MKKKIVALCLVVVLAVTAIGGATLAYFTDNDQKENNFTIGDIDIAIKEDGYVWDPNGNQYSGGSYVYDSMVPDEGNGMTFTNLMPSYIISKRPTIENISKNDAYVRVAVVINNLSEINEAIDDHYEAEELDDEAIQAKYDEIFAGWGVNYAHSNNGIEDGPRMWMTERNGYYAIDMAARIGDEDYSYYLADNCNKFKSNDELNDDNQDGYLEDYQTGYYDAAVNGNERVYVFYFKLDGHATSEELFGGLNIPAEFNNAQMEMFEDLKISIYADAIQAVGFKDVTDDAGITYAWEQAFKALNDEHPIGWWNDTTSQSE